jgi:hypothetical protein
MNTTTTERNWLQQFTTKARAFHADLLKIHKRDYDGWIPPDVEEMRKKVAEHDTALTAIKRGIMNIAGAFKK